MTYLLRNIVKACEILSTSPFRRALHVPAVGAEGWESSPFPHQTSRPTQPGTVCPVLPGDTEVLQTCCMCAHTCPLPVTWEKWYSHLGWLGNQHWKGWSFWGPTTSSQPLCLWRKGALKEMATVGKLQHQNSSSGVPRGSQTKKLPGPGDRLDKLSWGLQAAIAHNRLPVLPHTAEQSKAGLSWAGHF